MCVIGWMRGVVESTLNAQITESTSPFTACCTVSRASCKHQPVLIEGHSRSERRRLVSHTALTIGLTVDAFAQIKKKKAKPILNE